MLCRFTYPTLVGRSLPISAEKLPSAEFLSWPDASGGAILDFVDMVDWRSLEVECSKGSREESRELLGLWRKPDVGCVKSTLCDFLREDLRGTCGLADGIRVGISGIREASVVFAALREPFDVALEGNLLGSSIPVSPISIPGSIGGTSEILVTLKSPSSSSESSSSDPRGRTRVSFSGEAAAAVAFDGPA
jgi:hypothetical protein